MIDSTPRDIKADVHHTVTATADTIQDIHDNAATLKGHMLVCKEDQFLYFVCANGAVTKTNLRSREQI